MVLFHLGRPWPEDHALLKASRNNNVLIMGTRGGGVVHTMVCPSGHAS